MVAFLLACLIAVVCYGSPSKAEVDAILDSIKTVFDATYPSPPYSYQNGTTHERLKELFPGMREQDLSKPLSVQQIQNIHDKRCFLIDNSQAVDYFLKSLQANMNSKQLLPVLAATPCLGGDSLGNMLGSYFENVACAQSVGMHFYSLAHVWEPETEDRPTPFLQALPSKLIHPQPVYDPKQLRHRLKSLCKCPGSCHERPYAVWTKHLQMLRSLFWDGIDRHLSALKIDRTIVNSGDVASVPVNTALPLVPDVAIHYRCGDNFVGHYGFLPFRAFVQALPRDEAGKQTIKTLYVLAEARSRKTSQRPQLAAKCDAVFTSLFGYLRRHFPQTTIVIKRGGDDLYTDLVRLASARYLVCSVSTFCLWPALFNRHVVYPTSAASSSVSTFPSNSSFQSAINGAGAGVFIPRSKLFVGGRVEEAGLLFDQNNGIDGNEMSGSGLHWIREPAVVLGKVHYSTPPAAFTELLAADA